MEIHINIYEKNTEPLIELARVYVDKKSFMSMSICMQISKESIYFYSKDLRYMQSKEYNDAAMK